MSKKIKLIIWSLTTGILLLISSITAYARIIFVDDVFENNSEIYQIGSDDDADTEQLGLQFGGFNPEYFYWDTSGFTMSDDITVEGNAYIEGIGIMLDSDNTGTGGDVYIAANQGSDNPGYLRYNSVTNRWELSNDGGSFEEINTGSAGISTDLASAQARRTGNYSVTTTWTDISLDTTDIENDPAVVDHDALNTDRINVYEDGIYMISYIFNPDGSTSSGTRYSVNSRVRINDSTVINGSEFSMTEYQQENVPTSTTFVAELSTNDFVSLQLQRPGGSSSVTIQPNSVIMTITKMEGIKGEKGDPGPPGSVGAGTDYNTFTLDQDDTGGDVALQFGTTLAETLTWDSINSEFDLSENLDINESGEVIEFGDGLSSDILMTFDDGTDRNLGWDVSISAIHIGGAFSTFNEELAFRTLQGSDPPVACSSTYTGMQWMDTDTGIIYACDTSNGRNKWLSIAEYQISGGESWYCSAGSSPSAEACTQDIHNGVDANDMGYYLSRDITIVGGSFHSDTSCTDGSGVDLEIANGENAGVTYLADILTGCTDPNGCSTTGLNIDVNADDQIRARLDNNCSSGIITDWSSLIIFRYRHD